MINYPSLSVYSKAGAEVDGDEGRKKTYDSCDNSPTPLITFLMFRSRSDNNLLLVGLRSATTPSDPAEVA